VTALKDVAVTDVTGKVGQEHFVAKAVGLPESQLDALGETHGAADKPGSGRPGLELDAVSQLAHERVGILRSVLAKRLLPGPVVDDQRFRQDVLRDRGTDAEGDPRVAATA
jgi:hypothetical protein